MDPYATLEMIEDAVADRRSDDAAFLLGDLLRWMQRGGFYSAELLRRVSKLNGMLRVYAG